MIISDLEFRSVCDVYFILGNDIVVILSSGGDFIYIKGSFLFVYNGFYYDGNVLCNILGGVLRIGCDYEIEWILEI